MPNTSTQTDDILCMSPYINYMHIISYLLVASDHRGETNQIIEYAEHLDKEPDKNWVESFFASFDEYMAK
jgi:hypothetical protein